MIRKDDVKLLQYSEFLQTRKSNEGTEIFDPIRKTWLVAQPEEYVRQLFVQFLLLEEHWTIGSLSVEKSFKYNGLAKRWDLVAFDRKLMPIILFEFKSPEVPLDSKALQQLSVYTSEIRANYLVLSNGLMHQFYRFDPVSNMINTISQIPGMNEL